MKKNISPMLAHKTRREIQWKINHLVGVSVSLFEGAVSQYLEILKSLLAEPRYSFADASSKDVPKQAGVYAIFGKRMNTTIYAGRTKNLKRRLLGDHRRGNIKGSQFRKALGRNLVLKSEEEITCYILKNCSFQFLTLEEFEEIVRLEHFAIAVLSPILNVRLKQ
jgi:predicted GIY-YIG superfamily endonuclease